MSGTVSAPALPRTEPAERGATRIADRVVAGIASQAAREALRTLPHADQATGARPPAATVEVRRPGGARSQRRSRARVRLTVEVGYPADLRAIGAAVRRRVVERVGDLAGMDVPEVHVQVERLHSAATAQARGRVT